MEKRKLLTSAFTKAGIAAFAAKEILGEIFRRSELAGEVSFKISGQRYRISRDIHGLYTVYQDEC